MENDKTHFMLISIVAIVAVVGIVALVLSASKTGRTGAVASFGPSENMAGETTALPCTGPQFCGKVGCACVAGDEICVWRKYKMESTLSCE